MANIISASYFGKGTCYVPNITTATGSQSDLSNFNDFLALNEVEYLKGFFGYELATIIINAYNAFIDNATPLPDRIADIINGKEFTDVYGNLQKWEGLKRSNLVSPIANYVYYYWRKDKVSDPTITGEIVNDPESSLDIGPGQKMVTAWNYGVEQNKILYEFLYVNSTVYPEFNRYTTNKSRISLLVPINIYGF